MHLATLIPPDDLQKNAVILCTLHNSVFRFCRAHFYAPMFQERQASKDGLREGICEAYPPETHFHLWPIWQSSSEPRTALMDIRILLF